MSTFLTTDANSQAVESLTETKAWKTLEAHYEQVSSLQLRDLFAGDPERGERLTLEAAGLFLDYS